MCINNCYFLEKDFNHGVPQDSVLGLFLIFLYINSIFINMHNHQRIMHTSIDE